MKLRSMGHLHRKGKVSILLLLLRDGFLRRAVFLFDPLNLRLSVNVLQLLWAVVGGNAS